jgi:hypothetical protein
MLLLLLDEKRNRDVGGERVEEKRVGFSCCVRKE